MLEEYRKHVDEGAASGTLSCSLIVEHTATVIELLRNPPVGGAIA